MKNWVASVLFVAAAVGSAWNPDGVGSSPEPTIGAINYPAAVGPLEPAARVTPPTADIVTTTEAPRYHHPNPQVDQWFDVAVEAGWPAQDWPRVACIINRESAGQPDAYNGSGRDDSYGLMQLNMRAHRSWVGPIVGGDFAQLFDPFTNLRVARMLFDKAVSVYGNGWQPWNANDGTCQ